MSAVERARAIVYVIPAYPPLGSQPFVVNEMLEVVRAGRPLVILGLYPGPPEPVQHGTFAALRPTRVLPARLVDLATLGAALLAVLRWPTRVLRTLAGLHVAAGANPWAQARLLAVTPKALASAWRLRGAAIGHVHAHFANTTADCAAILARTLGVPFSFTAHAYDIYSTALRLRNDTLAWKVRHAAHVIAISEFGAALLRRHLPPGQSRRVTTVRVGIPLELFRVAPWPADDGPLRLLCIARWCEKKGLDTLLDACALLRGRGIACELRLFGDGPLRPALIAQWTRLELAGCVTLGGAISQEDVAREMRECHVFVLPCRRDRTGDMDGIPTVFMEAMATGRPVVSCGISGIPELVRPDETGLLAPSDDAEGIAAALARLAADRTLARRLGLQGRTLVEGQHDQRRCAAAMLAALGGEPS
jgi:glycosyltransferase involved in cell wall biosynthesis